VGGPVREGLCGRVYIVGKDILVSEGDGKSKSKGNGRAFCIKRSNTSKVVK
jgi:hypothetical protein